MNAWQFAGLLATALLGSGGASWASVFLTRRAAQQQATAQALNLDSQSRRTDTDADIVLRQELRAEQLETLKQSREAANRADKSREDAESARQQCAEELRKCRAVANTAFDVIEEEILPQVEDLAHRARARQVINDARAVI